MTRYPDRDRLARPPVRGPHPHSAFEPCRPALTTIVVVALLWSAQSAASNWQPYEIGIANREAGRMRSLAERLSKQNLLYQLDLGDVQKRDMHHAVNEIDRILEQLHRGSTYYSVAGPPNEEARQQLASIENAWVPVRKLALASPYDYLRRAQQFIPPESPRGDPKVVKAFDKMAARFIREVEKLMDLYYAECVKTEYRLCDVSRRSGQPTMLAERVLKNLVFIQADLDPKRYAEQLSASIEAFDANWVGFAKAPLYQAAIEPERGEDGRFIAGLRTSIDSNWTTLRKEARLAIAGRANEVDIDPMLKAQRDLVGDFERFVAVIGRFAAGEFGR